jgi:non-heme chloroperoxidase
MTRILLHLIDIILSTQLSLLAQSATAARPPKPLDTSPHTVRFIAVDKDVKLEVLHWGGHGRPMIFSPGSESLRLSLQ